eukprot:6192218-Pleurochrysis_carterae.AAC.3
MAAATPTKARGVGRAKAKRHKDGASDKKGASYFVPGALLCVVAACTIAFVLSRRLNSGTSSKPAWRKCAPIERRAVRGCTPMEDRCGRVVINDFASAAEIAALRDIAARGMALGGGASKIHQASLISPKSDRMLCTRYARLRELDIWWNVIGCGRMRICASLLPCTSAKLTPFCLGLVNTSRTGAGGPTILDLHSGALSRGDKVRTPKRMPLQHNAPCAHLRTA